MQYLAYKRIKQYEKSERERPKRNQALSRIAMKKLTVPFFDLAIVEKTPL